MNKRIFSFELDGKIVLGFDTGLSAQAFAQAKMAQFVTTPGYIVFPDGKVETWQSGGVSELVQPGLPGTMVVWGPSFPGGDLAGILNESSQDTALNALRFWLRAREALNTFGGLGEGPYPGPAGALVVLQEPKSPGQGLSESGAEPGAAFPAGTVFFPPARLLKRTLDAGGEGVVLDAERWVHPDLSGADEVSFSAGAMLYRIFCGSPPFTRNVPDELRQDIREGVFIPLALAAPGLDPELAGIIRRAMARTAAQGREEKPRPSPDFISACIGPPWSRPVSSWVRSLSEEELSRVRLEEEQYSKKKALTVKTRRFMIRNTTIITISLIALVALALFVRSYVKHQAELPNTKGMSPVEVAQTYYGAFGNLDHTLMDACVIGKAGKGDVEMVVNLYVISKMRQAYETTQSSFMSAQDWVAAGRPVSDKTVFGVTDLKIKALSGGGETASLVADYILWMPGSYLKEGNDTPPAADAENEASAPLPPGGLVTTDRLSLVLHKGAWRISEINRESHPLNQ